MAVAQPALEAMPHTKGRHLWGVRDKEREPVSSKFRDPAPLQQNQTSYKLMCPLWDSWATLTQEGLMEVGGTSHPTAHARSWKADCVPSPWIRRETTAWSACGSDRAMVRQEFQRWSEVVPRTVSLGLQATVWQKQGNW